MSLYKLIFITASCVLTSNIIVAQKNTNTLWYDAPATVWNEALPIGNGRIGAMVFGDPAREKVQLNESTFWSGGPSRNDNAEGPSVLDSIRYYLFNGEYKRAEILANQGLTAKQLHGAAFQALGNLNLSFDNHQNYSRYHRELDIENALFTTTYEVNNVTYKRVVFASAADDVLVIKLTSGKPGMLTFTASLDGELKKTTGVVERNILEMTGLSSTHDGVAGQVRFDTRVKIINSGGELRADGEKIIVKNADEVLILVSVATNFTDYQRLTTDEVAQCISHLQAAEQKSYSTLLEHHITSYRKYFDRVKFYLGTSDAAKLPTNKRIEKFATSNDPELVSLYYQFGRYLLICSSRPGGQPANLQGIWNGSIRPAWDSKYTININTEMNYWPAEKCNLPEMHEPLIEMIRELSVSGSETARVMYNCDGWVAHHNTDLWRITGVVDFANAGQWPLGGAWLSQHLWEKYIYGGDKRYLEKIYPVLKSASKFFRDFLVEDPSTKWLVVSPSISPENTPEGHQGSALAPGNTMDNQLVFDLFAKTVKSAKILNVDKDLAAELQSLSERLPPMQIGRYGQLQEWIGDWDNPDDRHRHISHLYGLYPGNQITPYTTTELFGAARTVLQHRGDVSTGWSMGWKVNLWARLLDGNHAFRLIKDQLTLVDPVNSGEKGGTYPNLFDAHPPFQIDGNFGCTSGITEMLLQTHSGDIAILPALPDEWKDGYISGLRAYGGFEVSFQWKNNEVDQITIKSQLGGNCRIRVPNQLTGKESIILSPAKGINPNPFFEQVAIKSPVISAEAKNNEILLKQTYSYDLATEAGKTYTLTIKRS